jgi:hypothetical protein
MSSAGFEPTIPASERPQTHALDRAANGIESNVSLRTEIWSWSSRLRNRITVKAYRFYTLMKKASCEEQELMDW